MFLAVVANNNNNNNSMHAIDMRSTVRAVYVVVRRFNFDSAD